MLMPSQGVRILVATRPVDFRKGHDGLASMVQSALAQDPFTGTVFVFRAKRADRMKILFWDGSGLVPLGTLLRNALPRDKAYDTRRCYAAILELGAEPLIPIRRIDRG